MQGSSRDELLDRIQSPSGKLVYLYLETRGEATVDELQDALDVSQLKLYPILRTLSDRGIVEQESGAYQLTKQKKKAPAPA